MKVKSVAGVRPKFHADAATDFKAVRDELMKAFETFKANHGEQIAEVKRGFADVVKADKVDRINAAVEALQKVVDEQNAKLAAIRLNPTNDNDDLKTKAKNYAKAFNTFARRGNETDIRAAMSTDSDPDGGYMVTEEMDRTIDRVVAQANAMRRLANVRTLTGNALELPTTTAGVTSGWVGERTSRTETTTPRIEVVRYPLGELYALPYATQTMLDDAGFNVEQYIADEVSIAFADKEGGAFITGDGNIQPKGFLSYTIVADASWAWGKIGYIATGVSNNFHATLPQDNLMDLMGSLKDRFLPNANWLMNRTIRNTVRKFKDGQNNYLWQPSLVAGQNSTLMGYPVEIDDTMANVGANNYPIAFGDFRQGYQIVEKNGTRVLRDPYTTKGYIGFYTTKRVGGGVKHYEAIKVLKCATS